MFTNPVIINQLFTSPVFASFFASLFAGSLALLAIGMIMVGVGLTVVTAWFWYAARPEPEALAPLEIMSERQFVSADDDERKRLLHSVRAAPDLEQTLESDTN